MSNDSNLTGILNAASLTTRMKDYFILSYINDSNVLSSALGVSSTVLPKSQLSVMELAELRKLSGDVRRQVTQKFSQVLREFRDADFQRRQTAYVTTLSNPLGK